MGNDEALSMKKKTYTVQGKVWLYPGENASWHFVNVPKKESAEIKAAFGDKSKGWGSIPVSVTVGKTTWDTSLFPDKRSASYLLPLKVAVRMKEGIREGSALTFTLKVKM